MQLSDADRLDRTIVRIDGEFQELIPGFLNNRQKDVAAILTALDRGDFEHIGFLGHNMKGTSAAFGFEAMGEIGARIEQAVKDKDAERIRQSVDELSIYLARVEVIFE